MTERVTRAATTPPTDYAGERDAQDPPESGRVQPPRCGRGQPSASAASSLSSSAIRRRALVPRGLRLAERQCDAQRLLVSVATA